MAVISSTIPGVWLLWSLSRPMNCRAVSAASCREALHVHFGLCSKARNGPNAGPAPPPQPPAGPPPEVSYTDRVRAMCVLMGVGTIGAGDLPTGAMAAAIASVKDRSAFARTNYADDIGQFVHG